MNSDCERCPLYYVCLIAPVFDEDVIVEVMSITYQMTDEEIVDRLAIAGARVPDKHIL